MMTHGSHMVHTWFTHGSHWFTHGSHIVHLSTPSDDTLCHHRKSERCRIQARFDNIRNAQSFAPGHKKPDDIGIVVSCRNMQGVSSPHEDLHGRWTRPQGSPPGYGCLHLRRVPRENCVPQPTLMMLRGRLGGKGSKCELIL